MITIDPNAHAAKEIMSRYGKTIEDLQSKLVLFNIGDVPKSNEERGDE